MLYVGKKKNYFKWRTILIIDNVKESNVYVKYNNYRVHAWVGIFIVPPC